MILGRVFCSQIKVMEWRKECDFEIQNYLDVWRVCVSDFVYTIKENMHLLNDTEVVRSESYVQEADRNRYLIGRIYLRKLIASYLKVDPKEVCFSFLEFNKPVLTTYSNFKFNISHSGDYLIIGFANRWSVGVDIELMNTKVDLYNLIYNTMSSVEVRSILNSGFPREIFYKHWTRKEALLKGVGVGLTDRLKDINCCDGLNFVPSDLSSFATSWKVRNFIMDDSYTVSIAHDTAIRVLRFYELGKSQTAFPNHV